MTGWDPGRASEPVPPRPEPPSQGRTRPGPGFTVTLVLAAAVFSALLASGATLTLLGGGRSAGPILAGPTASSPKAGASTTPDANAEAATPDPSASALVVGVDTVATNVAAAARPSVVTIAVGTSRANPAALLGGSGFLAADGLILTAAHLVGGASQVSVILPDRRQLAGRVVASDATLDLAVIRVDGVDIPALTAGATSTLAVGQVAIVIGSPLGSFSQSVTKGIISGLDREFTFGGRGFRGGGLHLSGLIQTDAAISAGNAGGPLLNSSGQVIGIVVTNSSEAQGLGFAIPIDAAKDVLAKAAGK